ncbi:hypothetical protein AG4045_012500 [Apium graveolens]|uniref:Late embryogenesis abundant protein LEA-2 subgroup domain-containing protein n=1 Tax=Apium graveolens TaxID=4045 RepID=A0A6L5BB85_APIGR|nr:hypothetical protein AG4045_012500 [Apium graveolens]
MGHWEDLHNPKYHFVKCVCGWTLVFLFAPPGIWLSLSIADQTSISCSIEDFYADGLPSTNVSSFNQSRIYFQLYLGNSEEDMGVYYNDLNLTFSYYSTAGNIVSVGNYTIHGFHQGIESKTQRKDFVVMTQGLSLQEISSNRSLIFRVDLGTAMKFREIFSKAKSKTRKIMAWAKVEVDPITGKKITFQLTSY